MTFVANNHQILQMLLLSKDFRAQLLKKILLMAIGFDDKAILVKNPNSSIFSFSMKSLKEEIKSRIFLNFKIIRKTKFLLIS